MRKARASDGRCLLVALALAAALALDGATVAAFDLSGTWTGKIACKGTLNGQPQSVTLTPTLIVDGGAALDLAADAHHYAAVAFPNPAHPDKGEIVLIACDTSPTQSGAEFGGEFGRMRVNTKTGKVGASLTGTSLKASLVLASSVSTCKWSFRRIALEHPALSGCNVPTPSPTP